MWEAHVKQRVTVGNYEPIAIVQDGRTIKLSKKAVELLGETVALLWDEPGKRWALREVKTGTPVAHLVGKDSSVHSTSFIKLHKIENGQYDLRPDPAPGGPVMVAYKRGEK